MKQVRTAKGRLIDMGALAKANEEVRAVSNVRMNARGDRLDASGNVIKTVQSISRTQHETASVPEKRKMSDLPGASKKSAKSKTQEPVEETGSPKVVSKTQKEREDGSKYVEIEYDDGSMEVKDIE